MTDVNDGVAQNEGDIRYATEIEFIAAFLKSAHQNQEGTDKKRQEAESKLAWQAAKEIGPEMLTFPGTTGIYEVVRTRFAAGQTLDPLEVQAEVLRRDVQEETVALGDIISHGGFSSDLIPRAKAIQNTYRQGQARLILNKATDYFREEGQKNGGQAGAEHLAMKMMSLYSEGGVFGGDSLRTPDESIDELEERTHNESLAGVPFPLPLLERHAGPALPGDVIGITGYSNSGKSSWAANMFWDFVGRNQPCIGFSTEMGVQWVERGVAAKNRVSQKRVEKRLWKDAEAGELERYLAGLKKARDLGENWQVIPTSDISPSQIITSTKILRQKWKGRPVIVFVDHMHRLDYGGEDADKMVGPAVKALRNMGKADTDGGIIWILLFQPRKPEIGKEPYGFVMGHQIRGHSSIWNELDMHFSPGRFGVKVYKDGMKTEWGTPKGKHRDDGFPEICPPDDMLDDRKLDDEHMWVKIEKRRTGGEGPVVYFDFDPRYGLVYEQYKGEAGGR